MKRDPDLIRSLLLRVEREGLIQSDQGSIEGYHLRLMQQAGFLEDPLMSTGLDMVAGPLSLRGQEFLELCRDEKRWKAAVTVVQEKTGGRNFQLIEALLRNAGSP